MVGSSNLADRVTSMLDESLPGFASRVRHCSLLTPRDLAERYGLTEGAVTHGELTLDQIMFMRPVAGSGQYAMPVAGLYLGGAGAHPGPGVLGGPGWLAARRVLRDRK
jgi:phytoene dehydrogenase-like protein